MIYSLTGKVLKKTLDMVVISCGGVGYQVMVPASVAGALPGAGQEATVYTYLNISENDISLFGFATEEQKACFALLTGVSGVGPKLAQRIVLELKDKVGKGLAEGGLSLGDAAVQSPTGNLSQAIAALVSLGYSQSEAAQSVAKVDETLPVEEIIKLALRSMAGRR